MTREEEQRIIQKVKGGDANAFEALVLHNQSFVYNMALSIVGNEADALDISQDVFLKAYMNLDSFRGESKFSVWLHRITYNACVDFKRKAQTQRVQIVPLTYMDEDGKITDMDIPDPKADPQEILSRAETREAVLSAIQSLPEDSRRIITLREFGHLSYQDIADMLSLNSGTVKSRLARARLKVLKILTENGTFDAKSRQTNRKEGETHV